MHSASKPRKLADILDAAWPGTGDGRVPPPELMADWQREAGPPVARRARPVCLKHDGVLVVAVTGSVWHQEITLAAPQLTKALARRGHAVTAIKVVQASSPSPPTPPPPRVELGAEDLARAESAVARAADPRLRAALARVVRAQLAAAKAAGQEQD